MRTHTVGLKAILRLIVALSAISACSVNDTNNLAVAPVLSPTSSSSTPSITVTAYSTAPPSNTVTVVFRASATPKMTATPTTGAMAEVFQIESGYFDGDHPELSRSVVTVLWSDDEKYVYYGFVSSPGDKLLQWATYDIANQSTVSTTVPLRFDSSIWKRLKFPDRPIDVAYPEIRGYISPSGMRAIYTSNQGTCNDTTRRTDIWIADSKEQHEVQTFPRCGHVLQAAWFGNESKVLFEFGYEGPGELYIIDAQATTVTPLAEVSDFSGATEETWALSPDGTTLAVISDGLRLVSLKDGKSRTIEQHAAQPYWSRDGKLLYYWWGPSFDEVGKELRVFDVLTGNISTVVDKSGLAQAFHDYLVSESRLAPDFYARAPFAVSSNGDQIVLWGGWLWLVSLKK